jgi:hypothetical protein
MSRSDASAAVNTRPATTGIRLVRSTATAKYGAYTACCTSDCSRWGASVANSFWPLTCFTIEL